MVPAPSLGAPSQQSFTQAKTTEASQFTNGRDAQQDELQSGELASAPQSWRIDPSTIRICKGADGGSQRLGQGSFGAVRAQLLAGLSQGRARHDVEQDSC